MGALWAHNGRIVGASLIAESSLALEVNHALITESRFGPFNHALTAESRFGPVSHALIAETAGNGTGHLHLPSQFALPGLVPKTCWILTEQVGSGRGAGPQGGRHQTHHLFADQAMRASAHGNRRIEIERGGGAGGQSRGGRATGTGQRAPCRKQ